MNYPDWLYFLTPEQARELVAAAVRCYIRDIRIELSTGKNPEPYAEYPSALDDFTGQRYQLARLCRLAGLEITQVAEHIEKVL